MCFQLSSVKKNIHSYGMVAHEQAHTRTHTPISAHTHLQHIQPAAGPCILSHISLTYKHKSIYAHIHTCMCTTMSRLECKQDSSLVLRLTIVHISLTHTDTHTHTHTQTHLFKGFSMAVSVFRTGEFSANVLNIQT